MDEPNSIKYKLCKAMKELNKKNVEELNELISKT
jgi:hypothetical protein